MISESAQLRIESTYLLQASEHARRMLDTIEVMFDHAIVAVWLGSGDAEARKAVSRMDRGVDAAQAHIRQAVLTHLTASPGRNAAACLALMVVAKDAERAGDYCKNLTELADLAHAPLGSTRYGRQLADVFADVKRLFAPVQAVLNDPSTTLLRLLTMRSADIEERCSTMIRQIANDPTLGENDAVCLALVFRGCRRISAHLSNMACAAAGLLAGINHHAGVSASTPQAAARPKPVPATRPAAQPDAAERMIDDQA